MNNDLKIIKEKYGEKMMHLCRELFSTLLETNGLLSKLMLDNFYPTRFLYEDIIDSNNIEEFKNYIYSLVEKMNKTEKIKSNLKTPSELLDEAGYILYECKSEDDIQKFKKYYLKNEELCTFFGGRLNYCHVFFAVKKNVDEIKRENFANPERQDEYGTSVISIQFRKGAVNTLSIKNRYNHAVVNPDATYSNNLENIIQGLTDSFEYFYNLNINQNENGNFELPGYVKANDGKYYKYNYEINNTYYCPDNIIIEHFDVKKYDKEKYIVLDYFILDLVNKKIHICDMLVEDSFLDYFWVVGIKKIAINKDKSTGNKKIEILTDLQNNLVTIEIDKYNRIIGYINNELLDVEDDFLESNASLEYFKANKLESVERNFLGCNESLKELVLPKLVTVYSNFLRRNKVLEFFEAPNLQMVGNNFLGANQRLVSLDLPNLEEAGESFLDCNSILSFINLPKLKKVSSKFLSRNEGLTSLSLPELDEMGRGFLPQNKILHELNLPKVKKIGIYSLSSNLELTILKLPNVETIEDCFLYDNKKLEFLEMPKLKKVRSGFLSKNNSLKILDLPELEIIGNQFLYSNFKLKEINLPKLRICPGYFSKRYLMNEMIDDSLDENVETKVKLL